MPLAVDQTHLLHETLGRHLGPTSGHFGIVEREIAELFLAVPPGQFADLGGANPTVAVEDYHLGVGPIGRAGQSRSRFCHGSDSSGRKVLASPGIAVLGSPLPIQPLFLAVN